MSDRPKRPFEQAAKANQKNEQVRDKDNADKRIPPPRFAPHGEINRAPRGASGIRRDLPNSKTPKPSHRVSGDLKREFKPIVTKSNDKDRGHDR